MTRELPPREDPVDPAFFSGLAEDGRPDDATLEALLTDCEAQLDAERGARAWLRQRPTASRLGLGLGLPAGLVLVALLFAPRPDIGDVPAWRILGVVVCTAALLAASVWFGLRPLHRPPVPAWLEPAVVGAALLGAVGLAAMPLLEPIPPAGAGDWGHALGCLYGGVLIALPVFVILRLLDRGGRVFASVLSAAAAGLGANGVLALHCANDALGHTLRGHVGVMVALVGATLLWTWVRGRIPGLGRPG